MRVRVDVIGNTKIMSLPRTTGVISTDDYKLADTQVEVNFHIFALPLLSLRRTQIDGESSFIFKLLFFLKY